VSSLKFSLVEKENGQDMFFTKSITIGDEDLNSAALAADPNSARSSVESGFIERLKTGESEAFDLFVTHYSVDVYALLYRLTENAEDAGDLTQETFLSALKAIKNFRGDADLKTWLFRIAINESRNRFRWWKRRKREKTVSLDDTVGSSEMAVHETLPGDSPDPEQNTLRRERERGLTDALLAMPVHFREVIVLCDIEGLSYEEISEALAINIGTVKSRIARGREELRRRLKDF
jgi:RNA polymerase sigma-70 factor (ECF subfamily)